MISMGFKYGKAGKTTNLLKPRISKEETPLPARTLFGKIQ
jgi:hypothetical protein